MKHFVQHLGTALLAASLLVGCGPQASIHALGTTDGNTSDSLTEGAPQPQVHFVNAQGEFVAADDAIEGVAPFALSVSAFPPIGEHSCYWDPTAWMAAGEYNLCSQPDPAHKDSDPNSPPAYHNANLPASAASKYFGPAQSLAHAESVESSHVGACFYSPYDDATRALIQDIQNCIRDRDQRYNSQISRIYLAGGAMNKTEFRWDFGDKGSAYNQVPGFNAGHVFSKPGTYILTLNVRSQAGVAAEPRHVKVVVHADNRDTIAINSAADLSKIYVASGTPNGRHIVFKRGVTFSITRILNLFSNDWVSASDESGALPKLQMVPADGDWNNTPGKVFTGHDVNQVVLEDFEVNAVGLPKRPVFSTVDGQNLAFRNIVFNTIFKGFDSGATGMLLQNVGAPRAADGTWQSNHLQSNFALLSPRGAAIYGNHIYTAKSDYNGEPQLRFNGGELVTVYDNDMGGWAGKLDQTSLRGSKSVYVSGNRMRGGVLNMQAGTSQNYQPAVLINNVVLESNTIENTTVDVGSGSFEVTLRNNIFRIRQATDTDSFAADFPYQNVQQLTIEGGPVVDTLYSQNISVVNNTIVAETSVGKLLYFDAGVKNLDIVNNLFYSTTMSPLTMPTQNLGSLHRVMGNAYFVGSKTSISSAAKSISNWNALPLPSKNPIQDYAFALSDFGMPVIVGSDPMQNFQPKAGAVFETSAVDLFTRAASDSNVVDTLGVMVDMAGRERPRSGGWTAGALQVQ